MLPCQQFGSWIPDKRAPIRVGNSSLETICFWLVKLLVNLEKTYSNAVLWSFCRFLCSSLPQRMTYITERSDSKPYSEAWQRERKIAERAQCVRMPQPTYSPYWRSSDTRLIRDPDMSSRIVTCGLTRRRRSGHEPTAGRHDECCERVYPAIPRHIPRLPTFLAVLSEARLSQVTCALLDGGWSLWLDDFFFFFSSLIDPMWFWFLYSEFDICFSFFKLLSVFPRLKVFQSFRGGGRGVVLPSVWPHTLLDNEEG